MRRRKRGAEQPGDEPVDLDAPEHAWWVTGPTDPDERVADAPVVVTPPPAPPDPYEVLRVAPDASWEDIVAAHRKLVRWWHPDGLGPAASVEEHELSATRMRELTAAYRELRVRRGR